MGGYGAGLSNLYYWEGRQFDNSYLMTSLSLTDLSLMKQLYTSISDYVDKQNSQKIELNYKHDFDNLSFNYYTFFEINNGKYKYLSGKSDGSSVNKSNKNYHILNINSQIFGNSIKIDVGRSFSNKKYQYLYDDYTSISDDNNIYGYYAIDIAGSINKNISYRYGLNNENIKLKTKYYDNLYVSFDNLYRK